MKEPIWLDFWEIVAIHNEVLAMSGGAPGILNENTLKATLDKAKNLYYYSENEVSLYDLAAAYGYGLIKNHCFIDGNKRICLIAMYTFLASNSIELNASEVDAALYLRQLAGSNDSQTVDLPKLAQWLEKNSLFYG
jgi:death-on-curing protein